MKCYHQVLNNTYTDENIKIFSNKTALIKFSHHIYGIQKDFSSLEMSGTINGSKTEDSKRKFLHFDRNYLQTLI